MMTTMPRLPFPLRTLSVGAHPIEEAAWFEPSEPAELAAKVATLDAHPEATAAMPGSEPAQAELAGLVGAADPTIGAAARLVVDDLCLLAGAGHVLVTAAVGAPNRWRLADKIGRPLRDIHGPVPHYDEELAAPVDRVLDRLGGRIVERRNWSVLDDPELFQPHEAPSIPADVDPATLWLRSERQTLRRLPVTGAIVFTIRTYQWPLSEVRAEREQAAGLAEVIAAASPAMLRYKGLDVAAASVGAWLVEAPSPS
jgi:dimethylamine monooxygenase subunit A